MKLALDSLRLRIQCTLQQMTTIATKYKAHVHIDALVHVEPIVHIGLLWVCGSIIMVTQKQVVAPINVLAFTWQFYHQGTNASV